MRHRKINKQTTKQKQATQHAAITETGIHNDPPAMQKDREKKG